MTYSNHFIMCVLVDGKPQKELGNGTVKLPFNSSYALRFRNKNNRRSVVKFFIDGDNVSGNGYVVAANAHIDIERHHDKDASFKFVSTDSEDAVEFGKNGPNPDKTKGLIEAHFFLEKERPTQYPFVQKEVHHHHHYDHYPLPYVPRRPWDEPWKPYWCSADNQGNSPVFGSNLRGGSYSENVGSSHDQLKTCSMNDSQSVLRTKDLRNQVRLEAACTSKAPKSIELKDGCTVEGDITGQHFGTTYIDTEATATVLKLFLQGHDETEPVIHQARKTNKDLRVESLEQENERLRKELAEIENQKLKEELAKKTAKKRKPRTKKEPKS
jgi:hypothetical protein